jgi:hypothetical protein
MNFLGQEDPKKTWRLTREKFEDALGKDRVRLIEGGLTLEFKLNDDRQLEQAHLLADLMGDKRRAVKFHAKTVPDAGGDHNILQVTIMRFHNDSSIVYFVADTMAKDAELIREEKENGEIRHRITPIDKAYVLEQLTGVPWDRVNKSAYGTSVVEAVLSPDQDTRRRQEFAVSNSLIPDGKITLNTIDWLNHQRDVEQRTGEPPHTALPSDWVTDARISRASVLPEAQRASVRKVFS